MDKSGFHGMQECDRLWQNWAQIPGLKNSLWGLTELLSSIIPHFFLWALSPFQDQRGPLTISRKEKGEKMEKEGVEEREKRGKEKLEQQG